MENTVQESSWYQRALESAIHETNGVEDRVGLARLAILQRLVSPASDDPNDEDALLHALATLRAIERERWSESDLATTPVR